tara:strand:+ start:8182 stop:8922 length:741 start_codon:yes stop_codon:yes gene_type:complete
MRLEYNKRQFPLMAEMPVHIDKEFALKWLEECGQPWEDPYTSQPGLSSVNGEVAEKSYGAVEHLCLTGPDKHNKAKNGGHLRVGDEIGEMTSEGRREFTQKSWKTISARDKLRGRAGHLMNEYNWGDPYDFYKGSELQKHLTEAFKAPIIRVRYAKMIPGAVIPPHIDYNTTYAVRFIIPLKGTKGVRNVFWKGSEEFEYSMEPGKCYFLNIGFKHAVYHEGKEERVYLIGSLGGQQDIEAIRFDK